jgi:aerobic carbon-monoxide dehydrogenase large subunit
VETREECLLVGGRQYTHRFAAAYDDNGRILAIRDRVLGDIGTLGAVGGWGMVYVAGDDVAGPV